jgi:hypothetical protein
VAKGGSFALDAQKTLFECLDVRFGGLRLGVGILVGEAWVPC